MGIIGALTPMMVLALSIVLLGQRLTAGAVTGSLLSIAGVGVVVSSGDLPTLLRTGVNLGDGLMLLAMLAYAVYVILLKRWVMKEVPPLQLLYLQIVVAVIALLPLYLCTPKMGLSAANLPLVGFAGLMASMIAPLMWMHTVARIGPSRATMFLNLMPLFTAAIAAAVIGESLAAYHAVGGVLTVAGVLLAELWKAPLRMRSLARS
jgi:drug/metabolite transporter (DMT)-like permease